MINWKAKLSSRKFWCSLVAAFIAVAAVVGLDEESVAQVVYVMGAIGALVAYVIVEGKVDMRRLERGEDYGNS